MNISLIASLIEKAKQRGASDLHIEPGLAPAYRVRGNLAVHGDVVIQAPLLREIESLVGTEGWTRLREQRSLDLSRTIAGTRCRIAVLCTYRGIGLAIRLLAPFQTTITRLNLLPDLESLADLKHGLVIVSGSTGSGKSTTMAGLIQSINTRVGGHLVTVEDPIEYIFKPKLAYVRQREVGRDTPSFEQAIVDAMREDPDVLMIGEMRTPETMRLTLGAAETGHLVLTTMHSATCTEALNRIISSFSAEARSGVAAQLADVLKAVVCQRLIYREDLGIRVPVCEVLIANQAVRATIRGGDLFRLASAIQTGASDGMYTYDRYQLWLDQKNDWSSQHNTVPPDEEPKRHAITGLDSEHRRATMPTRGPDRPRSTAKTVPQVKVSEGDDPLDLDGYEDDLGAIMHELEVKDSD